MIHVIATVDLHEGRRDDFLAEFHQIVPTVKDEAGCIEYGPTVDVETNIAAQAQARADTVTIIEKWENIESLEAHLIAPHMMAYRERVKPMVKGALLQILRPA